MWNYPCPGKELQVFPGGQFVEEDVVLRADAGHLADLFHVVGVADVVAEDVGWPRGHRCHPGQHVEQGRLSGSIVACIRIKCINA